MTTTTRHSTLCVRPECRRPFSEHKPGCPSTGKPFRKHERRTGLSNSFQPDEVTVLQAIVREMGDSELAADPAFPRIARKVRKMVQRLEGLQSA